MLLATTYTGRLAWKFSVYYTIDFWRAKLYVAGWNKRRRFGAGGFYVCQTQGACIDQACHPRFTTGFSSFHYGSCMLSQYHYRNPCVLSTSIFLYFANQLDPRGSRCLQAKSVPTGPRSLPSPSVPKLSKTFSQANFP